MFQTYFHAVFVDETGCEFGAGCYAVSRGEALSILRERYPESRIVQLESPEDTQAREEQIRASVWEDEYGYHWEDDEWPEEPEDH